jgi:TRAP transporter TAXI family solute receptor
MARRIGALVLVLVTLAVLGTACAKQPTAPSQPGAPAPTPPPPAKKEFLTVTTATTGGTYYPVGVGMATLWTDKLKDQNINVSAQSSAGSVENIDILRKNEAQIAIMQGLIGAMAWKGSGPFENKAYQDYRAICSLWFNVEHFVLAADKAKTGNVMDIRGLRFSVGSSGSGTEQSTLVIMEGLGLTRNDIRPEYLGYNESAAAMKDGRIDGASLPAGPPVPAVTDLFASPIKVKILEFTPAQLQAINAVFPAWGEWTLPANTYTGQTEPVKTIAQPNWLAVNANVSDDIVYLLTKTLFENLDYMRGVHKACEWIKLETALTGLPVPLHPGAIRYFREVGLTIPDNLIPK